jgi:hypothetical protein
MRYRDIQSTANHRFHLPVSHPVLAEVDIEPADWHDFHRLDADNPATHIVGHDTPIDGRMTVYVACASNEVRKRLNDG